MWTLRAPSKFDNHVAFILMLMFLQYNSPRTAQVDSIERFCLIFW